MAKEKQTISGHDVGNVESVISPTPSDSEGLPIIRKKPTHFRTVITGAEFKEFEVGEEYVGEYIDKVIRKKDGPKAATEDNQKAGATMGYNFKDENGKIEIIGASQQVSEVMNQCNPGQWVRFTFLGKGETANKQPFNRFKIDVSE